MNEAENEIKNIIENQDPAYRSFFTDQNELSNYNQRGSYFFGMGPAKALIKTAENAQTRGLRIELIPEYLAKSSAWTILTNREKTGILKHFKIKHKQRVENYRETYFPGPIHIVETLNLKFKFRTVPEIGTDKESVYYYNGQIFERGEEIIKSEAQKEYIRQWEEMYDLALDSGDSAIQTRLKSALNSGPTANQINEVLAMIRRTTFTTEAMNPPSHIPFKNGLLNLQTRKIEKFSADLFFTYQINANLLTDRYITLKDTRLFANLLNTAFYETDIPMVLSYFAYTFYPDLPAHRVLFILGRERIGKGTSVRILEQLMPKGQGSISLARLLTSERFQFSGIEGKNLLIDSEAKRKFKRGTILEWSAFCNLFGKDNLNLEPKGKEARDYLSSAKGIFLGNLPFIQVDSPPAISRIIVVETRNDRPKREIKDLDKIIMASEKDQIATLLMQVLFHLIDRDFNFPGQLTDESTNAIMEQLADPVEFFIEDVTEPDDAESVTVDDAYSRFMQWCNSKGIPIIARQTFVKRFGFTYPKKRLGPRGNRYYAFMGCILVEEDVDLNMENKNKVGHGADSPETMKINASRERYRRVQHASSYLHVRREEKNNNSNNKKYTLTKLDTGFITSRIHGDKASESKNPVSNLSEDFTRNEQIILHKSLKIKDAKKALHYYRVNANFEKYGYEFFNGSDIEMQGSRTYYYKDSTKIKYMLYQLLMPEEPENTPDGWFSFSNKDARELRSEKEYNALSKGDEK